MKSSDPPPRRRVARGYGAGWRDPCSGQRITLLDPADGSRGTLDRHLTWTAPDGATATLDRHAILETKSVRAATDADRWRWNNHSRPRSFSKFCIGMALHDRSLPANKWNRTLRNVFGWQPHHAAPPEPAAAARHDESRSRVLTHG